MRLKVSFIAVALMALAGVGFAQGQGGGGRQGRGGFGQGMMGGGQRLTQLLRNEQVQTELKITDDQKAKIAELPRGGRGAGNGGGGGQGGGQRTPPTAEETKKQMADDKAAVEAILTPEQAKRLMEIRVQWAGGSAATLPDVQEALALTADQKAKIADLQTKMREATMGMMEKMRNGEIERADMMPMMQQNNETFKTEVAKVLTADQNAKLKAMGGAELKQETRRPGGN